MPSHFYAYMARMKFIKRWGLRRNTREENDQEHSLQVAMIAHALCMLRNARYGGQVDPGKAVILAVYHEAAEVTLDRVFSPIKYFNPGIRQAYKDIERLAGEKLISYLPQDLREDYRPLLFPEQDSLEWRIVKAADKISAYLKCLEELGYGNDEFVKAEKAILSEIQANPLPEVQDFMGEFAPSFALTLDALN